MPNQFKTAAETPGLNVQGNEVTLPAGSLAVADNVSYGRDDIISMRFGFEACKFFLPVAKPESLFVTGDNLYVHINNQLWYLKFPLDCIYAQIKGQSSVTLKEPIGIWLVNNVIYFTQSDNVVRKLDLNTLSVSLVAGLAGVSGSADGVGSIARFNTPRSIYADSSYCYVSDNANSTIRRIEISSNTVTTIAGTAGMPGSANGVGAAARFDSPGGICGNATYLYICDINNYTIRRLEIATNTVTTIAGTAGMSAYTDGIGAAARFKQPTGICMDSTYLYVADVQTIRRIEIATNTVTTISGDGAAAAAIIDGTGSAVRYYQTDGINIDGNFLWITDAYQCVRRFNLLTTETYTFAGSTTVPDVGPGDGSGQFARFDGVTGLTSDSSYVYVTDINNDAIRRISKTTADVSYFAGYYTTPGDADGYILSILSGPNG